MSFDKLRNLAKKIEFNSPFLAASQFAISFLMYLSFPIVKNILPSISQNLVTALVLLSFSLFLIIYFAYITIFSDKKYFKIFLQYLAPIILFSLLFLSSNWIVEHFKSIGYQIALVLLLLFVFLYKSLLKGYLSEPVNWKFVVTVLMMVVVFFLGVVTLNDIYSFKSLPKDLVFLEGTSFQSYALNCRSFGSEMLAGVRIACPISPNIELLNGSILFRHFNGTVEYTYFNNFVFFNAPSDVVSIRFDMYALNGSGNKMTLSTAKPGYERFVTFPSVETSFYKRERLSTLFFALLFLILITIPKFVFDIWKEFESDVPLVKFIKRPR